MKGTSPSRAIRMCGDRQRVPRWELRESHQLTRKGKSWLLLPSGSISPRTVEKSDVVPNVAVKMSHRACWPGRLAGKLGLARVYGSEKQSCHTCLLYTSPSPRDRT